MSVPNLSAAVLNPVAREAGPRAAPATAAAADFLKYLPVADTPASPTPLADGTIRALAGAATGKPALGKPEGAATQVDAQLAELDDAAAAINVWLPMVANVPVTVPVAEATPSIVDTGLNAQAGRAQIAQATIAAHALARDGSLPAAVDGGSTADTEMLALDTPPERGTLGREMNPHAKPLFAAAQAELAATPISARDGAGITAALPEGFQPATTAGNGLERLLAEPAMAQERLFVSRPGSELLADPRYTLDASAGPQRLAETAAQRLSWMAGEKISRADLALNPPELGSVDVQLEIEGDQVRIQMTTATGAAKEMLDQALPRLRELFAQEGLQLTQADVSQHREQDARGRSADGSQARNLHGHAEEGQDERAAEDSAARTRQSHIGLLDQYA